MLSSENVALASKAKIVGKIVAVETIDIYGSNQYMDITIQTLDGSREVLVKAKYYEDNFWNLIDDVHRDNRLVGIEGSFFSYSENGNERATYLIIESIRTVEGLEPHIDIKISGVVSNVILTKYGAMVTLRGESNQSSVRDIREVDIELYSAGGEKVENFYSGTDKQTVVIQVDNPDIMPLSIHPSEKEWQKGREYIGLFADGWRRTNRKCFQCTDSRFRRI